MKRFLNKISPAFIHELNKRLLKNNTLGWQLQLPLITWLWLLISLVTLIVPFLYPLDISGDDDIVGTIAIAVLIAILQFFLYGYILIQFNSTKSFGKKILLHGLREQLAYLFVMILSLSQVIFFPLIIDYRKSQVMTEDEIKQEAITYNKARHYIMDDYSHYQYFPDDSSFIKYLNIHYVSPDPYYETDGDTIGLDTIVLKVPGKYRNRQDYYSREVEPKIYSFFTENGTMYKINQKFANRTGPGPKLYYIENDFLEEDSFFSFSGNRYYARGDFQSGSTYQMQKKADQERLQDIKALIKLYKKYEVYKKRYYDDIIFDDPTLILEKYNRNQFESCVKSPNDNNGVVSQVNFRSDIISIAHYSILSSKYNLWISLRDRAHVCFYIALAFSIIAFIFKNVRLKEFILSFVYSGLLALVVIIISVIASTNGTVAIHVPIIVFFTGLIFLFTISRWKHFTGIKNIFVIVSNLFFPFVPFFLFFYLTEYHDLWKYKSSYCEIFPAECLAHSEMMNTIQWICLWGGIALYLIPGSLLYKWFYHKCLALPLKK